MENMVDLEQEDNEGELTRESTQPSRVSKPAKDSGKGKWGRLFDTGGISYDLSIVGVPDRDKEIPSFFKDYDEAVVDGYIKTVDCLIEEYVSTKNVEKVTSGLRKLDSEVRKQPSSLYIRYAYEYLAYFVQNLASMVIEKRVREEIALDLLSALFAVVITPANIFLGFCCLLEDADDLASDKLDVLAQYIAHAVLDDILSPSFFNSAKEDLSDSHKGLVVLQTAEEYLHKLVEERWAELVERAELVEKRWAELVEKRWGGSTHITVEEVKKKITGLLEKYVDSGDTTKAQLCIRELDVPFFHHEIVKRALLNAMETPSAESLLLELLKKSVKEDLISSDQMGKGFSRMAESFDDFSHNIESAKHLVQKAKNDGWLDLSFPESSCEAGERFYDVELEKVLSSYRESAVQDHAKELTEKAVTLILKYFADGNSSELIHDYREMLKYEQRGTGFVLKLITLAMDRGNREKERAFYLMAKLRDEVFGINEVVRGWVMLLTSAEDTTLDPFDASNELAMFLARAVIERFLEPLDLEKIEDELPKYGTGAETVRMARLLIGARPAGVRFWKCWGGGTHWAVEDANDKIAKLLEKYCSGGIEACDCIHDLGMPFSNYEVVKKALVTAMQGQTAKMLVMLRECFVQKLITVNQMTKGFIKFRDLALDFPDAQQTFDIFIEHARSNEWLHAGFFSSGKEVLPSPSPKFW